MPVSWTATGGFAVEASHDLNQLGNPVNSVVMADQTATASGTFSSVLTSNMSALSPTMTGAIWDYVVIGFKLQAAGPTILEISLFGTKRTGSETQPPDHPCPEPNHVKRAI